MIDTDVSTLNLLAHDRMAEILELDVDNETSLAAAINITDAIMSSASYNVTSSVLVEATVSPIPRHVLISTLYLLGVLGNLTALGLLFSSKTTPRNPRLSLMLRCLAMNDLTAVLGMWIQMLLKSHIAGLANHQIFCSIRVVWRCFGLGSGCIVCVMAIDRWIALSSPFFYHRSTNVTWHRHVNKWSPASLDTT
ncbi:hypothetical protein O3M35_005929 [Rhynocoris fuscipes]|uniref:G-protein coupled receptors family 1 profile domain-containing protein n=1 Tax=Rhynocoris fuscipes TaxID=488301 RepID=A0AAW1DDZ9_9HEMI